MHLRTLHVKSVKLGLGVANLTSEGDIVLVAPQLKIAENRMTVTGEKGYCMIRATHGELGLQLKVRQEDLCTVPGCGYIALDTVMENQKMFKTFDLLCRCVLWDLVLRSSH